MQIRPLLISGLLAVALTALGYALSGGLPWGVDDGVKRLMARSWAESGGRTVLLPVSEGKEADLPFFPIPPPYAERADHFFRPIFPALFPSLGGALYVLFKELGFYLLPSISLLLLLFFFRREMGFREPVWLSSWSVLVLATPLLFYALTFWEHPLALLFLLPTIVLLARPASLPRNGSLAGLGFGAAVYLRPECVLLLPWLVLLFLRRRRQTDDVSAGSSQSTRRWQTLPLFIAAAAIALWLGAVCEKLFTGRWMPAQTLANLRLVWPAEDLKIRLWSILRHFWDSPFPGGVQAAAFVIFALVALRWRKPALFVLGLSLFAMISLLWGWVHSSAYGIVASSQGLFFALPWLGLGLLSMPGQKRRWDPLFVIGWGYVLLACLLGPSQPGMHWGPRFLFPALLPLLLRSAQVLKHMPLRQAKSLMIITGSAALLNGAASLTALGQRGQAGQEVLALIRSVNSPILILDRWHAGADLEPLWGQERLLWVMGRGNLEELLLRFQDEHVSSKIGFLKQGMESDLAQLPVTMTDHHDLPNRAGWRGELLVIGLSDSSDERWGKIFWHAARRRAEAGELRSALNLLNRAVPRLPEDPDLRYDLAVCLGRMGRTDQALDQLGEVLRLRPQHPAALELWRRLSSP